MKKIYVFLAVILLCVLILGVGFFIIKLGNLAHLFGQESQELIVDERSKFIGTWENIEELTLYTFANNGIFSRDATPVGTWGVQGERLWFAYDTGDDTSTYQYFFSDEDSQLILIDESSNQTVWYKQ